MSLPIGFYWLYNLLSSNTKKLLSAGKDQSYISAPPRPPKPKLAPPPPPPKPKSTPPPPTLTPPTPTPTVTYVPILIKPKGGAYTGGNSANDITWRNYWNAQAQKQDVYKLELNASQSPPPTAQYSDLSVAQRQMFRKKRSEGASWEEALNAARSTR